MIEIARNHPIVRVIPAIVWMAVIFALSSQSTIPAAPGFGANLTASAGHLVAYGLLGVLVFIALRTRLNFSLATAITAIIIATLYGMTDEIHQSFVAGRDASVADLVLDAIGATVAVAGWFWWRATRGKK